MLFGMLTLYPCGRLPFIELVLQLILKLQALAGDPGRLEVLAVLGRDLDRLVLVDDQRALDLALIDELHDLGGVNLLVRAARIRIVEHEKQQQHRYGD